jgi:protein-disulfide isomerase
MKRRATIAVVAAAALALVGCGKLFDKSGTCELTFEETSPDGTVPAGLEVCFADWQEDGCDKGQLRAVTLGLDTSGYVFTKGRTCEELGYERCDDISGMFYKTCPSNDPKKAKAGSTRGERLGGAVGGSKKRASAAKTVLEAPLSLPSDAPYLGNEKGKTVVQLLIDVQDPFGKRLMPTLKELAGEKSDLKIVARHQPLAFHQDALLAHQAALEAMSQKGNEGFWSLYELMLKNQRKLKRADLVGFAGNIGLDVGAFEAALTSRKHEARIKKDMAEAAGAGLISVPVLVMDKRLLKGAQPKSRLEAFLNGG